MLPRVDSHCAQPGLQVIDASAVCHADACRRESSLPFLFVVREVLLTISRARALLFEDMRNGGRPSRPHGICGAKSSTCRNGSSSWSRPSRRRSSCFAQVTSPSKQPGVIGCGQASAPRCASRKRVWLKRSKRLHGRRNTDCTSATTGWRRQARIRGRSSPRWDATGSAGLATLVRGRSRRITIMRFRPANIRLINRSSNLPRLLLALSSKNPNSTTKTTPRMRGS